MVPASEVEGAAASAPLPKLTPIARAAPAPEPAPAPVAADVAASEERPSQNDANNDDEDRADDDDDDKTVAAAAAAAVPVEELKDDDREHLNIVFIGHVDAGKSTISGQVLYSTGMVDERTIEKYTREATEQKRESWFLAYIMDTNEEERAKGKTVEVGRAPFATEKKRYTILDAPGHKNYVPNMIAGAAQADVAILVISARQGEFEAGFDKGGQTKEHALLIKTLGVSRVVVLVNKMDDPSVNWSPERYADIVGKLTPFLKGLGYASTLQLTFIPCSGILGLNIKKEVDAALCPFYRGPTLLALLDQMEPLQRNNSAPVRVPLLGGGRDLGTVFALGKVEQGTLKRGQKLLLMPGNVPCQATDVFADDTPVSRALAGENVKVVLKGVSDDQLQQGIVLSSVEDPVPCVSRFIAQVQLLELLETKPIVSVGYNCMIHLHTTVEPVTVKKLFEEINRKTGQTLKKNPAFISSNSVARIVLELPRTVALEKFADSPQLGRFILRDEGKTIAMGKIQKVAKPGDE